jgi:cell division protein FtsQ
MQTLTPAPLLPPPAWAARRPAKRRTLRWLWRGFKAALLLALCVGGGLAWRSGRFDALAAWAENDGVALLARCGFKVDEVDVVGRAHVDKDTLLATGGLEFGAPIFGFSPQSVRQRIESLPWVETAAVERRLPGTVAITIIERKPIALWQHNERISMIDAAGINLGPASLDAAPDLPLVVGGDAATHAAELLDLLSAHPEIAKRVQASSWIGSRRWDLKMDNGVAVLLPETGLGTALQQLDDAEISSRLLERDIVAVDLRLPGKLVVRLAHEPVAPKPARPQQKI